MKFHAAALLLLGALVGCASQHTFQVSVHNETFRPITAGPIKDGPPYEESWATPEELAMEHPRAVEPNWGTVITPGQTWGSQPFTGEFSGSTVPWLRVYAGKVSFSQMLAISSRNPNRLDVRLRPGMNILSIKDEGGVLAFTRATQQPPPNK